MNGGMVRKISILIAMLGLSACGTSSREDFVQLPTIDPAFTASALETPGVAITNVGPESSFVRLPSASFPCANVAM